MGISFSRRIAEATSCWLHYEYLCLRAGVFDESALKSAVGQVLSSFVVDKPSRVWCNSVHPALAPYSKSGRKAEIDFVLAELNGSNKGKIRIAVETKWANSTHCSPQNIIYDVFRLAMLDKFLKAQKAPAECIFLLAGTKPRIKELVLNSPFIGRNKISLKQGVPKIIKGDIFDTNKSGAWGGSFDQTASPAAKAAVNTFGFPDVTVSFSPGLPSIDLSNSKDKIKLDSSVKFYAMAWAVQGS